jgi:hypothetical protein
MRIPIAEHIKSAVIDAWVMGEKTRDKIAAEFNISTGSVSNIIKEWKNRIGVFEANSLRKLGLALQKAGMTPVQCVDGLRIMNIIRQLGIDDDHLFDFLKKLYNESKEQRWLPGDLARFVKVSNAYSEEINSLNDIPKIIAKRRQEKTRLDADILYRKREIEQLDREIDRKRKEIQDLQDDLESSRKKMQDEKKEFLLFKNVKEELKKHGIDIHILEPLIHVIKIFKDMHFEPLSILCEFSDINTHKNLVENKDRELAERESRLQNLKVILDDYERKIASKQVIVQSLHQLDNFGFNTSDIKNLEMAFSEASKKYGLNKKEIKIRFFRYMNRLDNSLSLEQDILQKTDNVSKLDNEILSRRKIIESQPMVFAILQYLVSSGLNEHYILMAFKIFKTDLCNNMPYGDRTYLERLSIDLNRYPTVRDTLKDLDNNILMKKSYIEKLAVDKSNLEAFLLSLAIPIIYFYSTLLLNAKQIQIQKNLIKRNLLISIFSYLLLLLHFCIVIKEVKKSIKSTFTIKQKNNNKDNKKWIKKKKVVQERKKEKTTKKNKK